MSAEEYLERVRKIDSFIRNKLRDYARWLQEADDFGGCSMGDRVKSSRNLHRGADAIGNYIDVEAEIKALKFERSAIIAKIEMLPRDEYVVLYGIYVDGLSFNEIAYNERKSYEWVKVHRRKGLDLIQKLIGGAE